MTTAYRGRPPGDLAVLALVLEGSVVRRWIESSFRITEKVEEAAAVVFTPDVRMTYPLPAVASLPVERDDDWFVADGAWSHAGVLADAYASSEATLIAALRFVLAEDRAARTSGPLRMTWLGPLGELFPNEPVIGSTFAIGDGVHVGRSPSAEICLRQGPHSDQNSVARRHAHLAPVEGGVHVYDVKSTNGIYVRGTRVNDARLVPGDELAICGTLRLRLDGALQ